MVNSTNNIAIIAPFNSKHLIAKIDTGTLIKPTQI